MSLCTIRVLLLGETEHGCSHLRRLLESRGCHCWFGTSLDDVMALFDRHSFHIVLSTIAFRQHDRLLTRLSKLPSTVFQSFPVEKGCWWLPIARKGKDCTGAPALREDELLGVLDQVVAETRPEREQALGAAS